MKNMILHRISLIIGLLIVGFVVVYSFLINYTYTDSQINYLFSLFYLIFTLNILGNESSFESPNKRVISIFSNVQNIIVSCILAILFGLMLVKAEVPLVKVFLILFLAFIIYTTIIVLFNRKIILVLFWINFYIFMGVYVFSQIPGFTLDLLSRYNPFGGLLITLLM